MSVTSIEKDYDNLTLTLVADFDAPIERVWQLWADPRQLERWWGPPSHRATVDTHELIPGGTVTYFMTAPDGEKHPGWWRIIAVDPPTSLEFIDGFADPDGTTIPDLPTTSTRMRLTEHDGGTRMVMRSVFDSREQMEQLVSARGATDGLREAVGQMDALLAS
jgi:uncharacterized protein YndB with AHSA1/START domain